MVVSTRLYTAHDLWEMGDAGDNTVLIRGELHRMNPPGGAHGRVSATLTIIAGTHVQTNGLGQCYTGDTGYILQRSPDTVLAPDFSFISADRAPIDDTGYLEIPPDLAVEVVSPSNSPGEIAKKVGIYLDSGAQAVWIIYPLHQQVVIYNTDIPPRVLTGDDLLTDDTLFPGLSFPVSRLFR